MPHVNREGPDEGSYQWFDLNILSSSTYTTISTGSVSGQRRPLSGLPYPQYE